MSTDISLQTTTYQVGNKQWLLSEPDSKPNVTLDISKFSANQTVVVTVGGSPTGGTFPFVVNGQTASIAYNSSASAAQTAIAALSTVGAGNVSVSGSSGGPFTISFIGALALQNLTLSAAATGLTGGTPTVGLTTSNQSHYANGYIPSGTAIGKVTSGGLFGPYDDAASDGRQTLYGFTYADVRAVHQNGSVATKVGTGAVVNDAIISTGKLPFQAGSGSLDANGKADVPTIRYEA